MNAPNDPKAESHKPLLAPPRQIVSCGDVACEILVDPIPRPKPAPINIVAKPKRRSVVLVDNRKPNSMAILRGTQRLLRERGIDVRDDIPMKPLPNLPMPDEMLEELAKDPGLILCGVSD